MIIQSNPAVFSKETEKLWTLCLLRREIFFKEMDAFKKVGN